MASRSKKKRRVTPEDLLEFRYLSDPHISPDGRRLVFVHKKAGEQNEYLTHLWLVDLEGGSPRPFTSGGKESQPRWSPRGDRIAFIGKRDESRPQIHTIGTDGGEAEPLTKLPEGSIGTFKWSPDGRHLALSFRGQDPQWTEEAKKQREESKLSDPPRVLDHWWYRLDGDGYFNGQRYHLYLVDAETGEHRKVYGKDTLGFFTFDFSPDSRQLVISTNRDRRAGLRAWKDELLRVNLATGRITPIPNLPEGPKDAVAWSPDGQLIAYAGRVGEDSSYSTENLELWTCDPVRGNARSLTGREDYCLMAVAITDTSEVAFGPSFRWSPDGKRIYAQIGWQGEAHVASVRRGGGRLTFHTKGPRLHQLGNFSADGRRAALVVGTPTKLDEIHVADLSGRDPVASTAVTDLNGERLRSLQLARPRGHWIKAADGTRVQVWSMLPSGVRRGRKLPAVLEVHGGPHAQYGAGFFHEFQVLAAEGYAVFFSNPRGSKGYGRDFCAAIRGSWGGADWVDVKAVIEFMKSRPFVDSRRLGIMGGSYGGYMTNWAIGHCHDFAAAITDRCVSNLVSLSGSGDFVMSPDLYWDGNAWDRPEARWRSSPLRHLGKVRTPTLIIHSEGDLRCNVEQAEQVFTALSIRNVPTRFIRYPRTTSHGMSRSGPPDLRIHRLRRILEWWQRYLKR